MLNILTINNCVIFLNRIKKTIKRKNFYFLNQDIFSIKIAIIIFKIFLLIFFLILYSNLNFFLKKRLKYFCSLSEERNVDHFYLKCDEICFLGDPTIKHNNAFCRFLMNCCYRRQKLGISLNVSENIRQFLIEIIIQITRKYNKKTLTKFWDCKCAHGYGSWERWTVISSNLYALACGLRFKKRQ